MELLILVVVIIAVHWFEYNQAIQEYTVSQVPANEVASVIADKTPIMFDVGALPWRPEIASKAAWTVNGGSVMDWLKEKGSIDNNEELAKEMELTKGLSEIDQARRFWWLPGLYNTSVEYLQNEVVALTWVTAEREWIGCSAGEPLLVWLTHSRYRPYLPESVTDPWDLTVENAPYIGRVQYIEVRIQPGWALGIPAHWGYAVRCSAPSWSWTTEQHSLLSLGITQTPAIITQLYTMYLTQSYMQEHEAQNLESLPAMPDTPH
jgi:hypothetical protein